MVCDGLRWSAMILEAQNRRKMTHFITTWGGGAPTPSLGIDSETDPESGSGE